MLARKGNVIAGGASVDASNTAPQGALHVADARRAWIGRATCVVVPIVIWFAPLPLEPVTKQGMAIAAFMILGWAIEAAEAALVGFIGCFLFWALHVVPGFRAAFSGFASDTAWFLFGALLLGAIATKSGLARRLAYLVMIRVGISYSRLLLGLIVTDFLLTLIVPSGIARVVIMASISLGLVEAFRLGPGSNVGRGIFLIITYTAGLFDKMIIAGAGAITARGAIEKFGGVDVQWSLWFIAYVPCHILTILAAWRLTLWLYPPEKPVLDGGYEYLRAENEKLGPWQAAEQRALALIAIATLLWVTDFLHHIPSSMIAMGVGLFALLPGVGILETEDMRRLNYLPIFFVAAAVSMGDVLAQTKGLGVLTDLMFAWMLPLMTNIFVSTIVLYWTAFVYHLFLASEIPMLATSIPPLMSFAKANGFNPLQLGMIWTFAAGGKIFAYQSAVMIVGYSYGFFAARDLLKIGAWLTIVEFLIVIVLVPLYWPLIGIK
jgi:solute carrier family 13 (sodium-dependent dicarboxylate transporter), member 2/3/5